jgi:hypothetical protein
VSDTPDQRPTPLKRDLFKIFGLTGSKADNLLRFDAAPGVRLSLRPTRSELDLPTLTYNSATTSLFVPKVEIVDGMKIWELQVRKADHASPDVCDVTATFPRDWSFQAHGQAGSGIDVDELGRLGTEFDQGAYLSLDLGSSARATNSILQFAVRGGDRNDVLASGSTHSGLRLSSGLDGERPEIAVQRGTIRMGETDLLVQADFMPGTNLV